MAKTKYLYAVEEWDKDGRFEFESHQGDGHFLAEDAADNAHSNHDGWESNWPLIFAIYCCDGTLIGRYSVDREAVPSFTAYKLAS